MWKVSWWFFDWNHSEASCLTGNIYSYIYRVSLFNTIVLRGVMQCYRLVGKGEFSASIGTYTIIITITMRIVRYNIKIQKKARQGRTFNSHARCFTFNSIPTPEHVLCTQCHILIKSTESVSAISLSADSPVSKPKLQPWRPLNCLEFCINGLDTDAHCTNDDQISVQLNRVHLWTAILTEFKSHFVAPTWTRISWPWFSWTSMVITWTTLIG